MAGLMAPETLRAGVGSLVLLTGLVGANRGGRLPVWCGCAHRAGVCLARPRPSSRAPIGPLKFEGFRRLRLAPGLVLWPPGVSQRWRLESHRGELPILLLEWGLLCTMRMAGGELQRGRGRFGCETPLAHLLRRIPSPEVKD